MTFNLAPGLDCDQRIAQTRPVRPDGPSGEAASSLPPSRTRKLSCVLRPVGRDDAASPS